MHRTFVVVKSGLDDGKGEIFKTKGGMMMKSIGITDAIQYPIHAENLLLQHSQYVVNSSLKIPKNNKNSKITSQSIIFLGSLLQCQTDGIMLSLNLFLVI